jgi:hypothetical protein
MNLEPSPEPSPILIKNNAQKPIQIPKSNEMQGAKPKRKPSPKSNKPQAPSPKPRLIPQEESPGPTPIPLSGEDFEEPIPLDEPEIEVAPQFGPLSASDKESKKRSGQEQLFNLFTSNPTGISGNEELDLVEDTSKERPKPRRLPTASPESSNTVGSRDPETLYQELISLEGKRYSIERSIRDLKTDRENGVLSDQEYKGKISQLLDKLQTISKRIEEIRKKLD